MEEGDDSQGPAGLSEEATATLRLGSVLLTLHAKFQTGRGKPSPVEISLFARTLYQERQLRNRIFRSDIFGEPAWDMLLDLFASEGEGKAVSVGSASLAAYVPTTTGLRYVRKLENGGMIERVGARDRRVRYLQLTSAGRTEMTAVLLRMMQVSVEPDSPALG